MSDYILIDQLLDELTAALVSAQVPITLANTLTETGKLEIEAKGSVHKIARILTKGTDQQLQIRCLYNGNKGLSNGDHKDPRIKEQHL